jgi:hypothetical protein
MISLAVGRTEEQARTDLITQGRATAEAASPLFPTVAARL